MTINQYLVYRLNGEVLYKGTDKKEAKEKVVNERDIVLTSFSSINSGIGIERTFYEDYGGDDRRFATRHYLQIYFCEEEFRIIFEALSQYLAK